MEAKDEVAENKSLENGTVNSPAVASEEIDEGHQDLSHFSKQEFVDLLKQLVHERDFRRSDAVIKEARNHFSQIQEQERSEALKKFVEGGGAANEFDYRPDALDVSFEANYKLLKDLRAEQAKVQEDHKSENLQKKKALLEDLRKLVDGEDDRHSFDKFKEIQKQWKTIGQVPLPQLQPLWASYHALVDRFYDNRNIYFELKELDRKKNLEAKLELCQRAEKLLAVSKIGEAIRELNELHEEYRHIGPVAKEEKDNVWAKFKKASDAVFEKRDAFLAKLHEELNKNMEVKEQVITEVGTFAAFQSDRIKEWNQKTTEILAVQKKWEAVGAVPRAKTKDINKRFWAAFKTFFSNKGQFFKKLDESRVQNLALKKQLIEQAVALKESKDWDKTANELKALQLKWKEIGPVPEKQREKIFKEFKTACDFFFDQRRVKLDEADKEQVENLQKKEAICQELERIVTEKIGTLGQYRELQRSFQSLGFVPRQAVASIRSRFTAATDKFMASLDQVSQEEKNKVILEIQLDNLKTDPDGAHKIHLKEQTLRKRIAKAENDLAILKNNLEFFARSKNADKVREEFNQKIEAGTQEIVQLKSQLKLLRAAT